MSIMKRSQKFQNSMRCFFYNNKKINRKLVCFRKSFWEVYHILNPKCMP